MNLAVNSPACDANTWVIIPARDEEKTIASVIQTLHQQGLSHILVVDNGSRDRTAEEAAIAGATVISEPQPGYGQACWTGMQNLPPAAQWVLFCDADGSDDLAQIPQFLTASQTANCIISNRRATTAGRRHLTPVQNFGNGLATTLIHWGWGHVYHDLGPLRLIQREALDDLQMRDRGFGWTVEMQVRAVETGLKIAEIPVGYYPRQGGRSKISGTIRGSVQAGTIILTTLAWLFIQRFTQPLFPQDSDRAIPFLSALLVLLGCGITAFFGDFRVPGTVHYFWMGIGLVSIGWLLSWRLHWIARSLFWSITLLSRLMLLPMYPGDDVWRYLWEGHIQTFGFSPYHLAPKAVELEHLRTAWWSSINHAGVSAIYPPITQAGFHGLASITPSVWLFKLAFIAADVLICALLCRRFGRSRTLLYAWNPLILYSFAGGAHYDSWFMLPLVAAWLVFDRADDTARPTTKQFCWAAALLGVSIAVKWMSAPILAFLVWRSLRQFGLKLAIAVGTLGLLPMALSAVPFCSPDSCPLVPTSSRFVINGRCAELIPFWVAKMLPESSLYNWLYLVPLALVVVWLLLRTKSLGEFCHWYLLSLLALSPIIHAWYFTWVIPFGVLSRNLGIRLMSLSAFVYFVLQQRQSLGDLSWLLTSGERSLLWGPILFGVFWSALQASRQAGEFQALAQLWTRSPRSLTTNQQEAKI